MKEREKFKKTKDDEVNGQGEKGGKGRVVNTDDYMLIIITEIR